MNGGAATAFLPNFVGFPSLRGLHSSTVQPRRTPERATDGHEPVVRAPAGTTCVHVVPAGVHPAVGCGSPFRSSAAPCQLPPPHPPPPPPQDDPPPHDELPPQDELEPHDELLPESPEALEPAAPPAHQLSLPPLPRLCRLCPEWSDCRLPRAPRTTADTRAAMMNRTTTMTRAMKATAMTSPSFRSPEAAPRGRLVVLRDVGMPACLTCQSRVEEVQSFGAG